jgi:hypothetical protein
MNLVEEKKKNQLFNVDKQKICKLAKKTKKFNEKNIIDKIHKLIVKELKLNVNRHIKKRQKSQTFFKSNNA